jgi:hypothetical protein
MGEAKPARAIWDGGTKEMRRLLDAARWITR